MRVILNKKERAEARKRVKQQKEWDRLKFAALLMQISKEHFKEGNTDCYTAKFPASEAFKLLKKNVTIMPADNPPDIGYVVMVEDK